MTKRQGDLSSNRLSTFVAVTALVVSMVSAGASAWQTLLVKEQLTASDRNRSFQELVQQSGNVCELFFPNRIKSYSYASQNDGTSIIAVAREDIDQSIYNKELSERIASESRRLRLAFTAAILWSSRDSTKRISTAENIVMDLFQYFSSPDISNLEKRDLFSMRYIKASHACTNDRGLTISASIAGLVSDEGSWWVQPDSKTTQVVLASRVELDSMSREEIQCLANKQVELLKEYDSYNQI